MPIIHLISYDSYQYNALILCRQVILGWMDYLVATGLIFLLLQGRRGGGAISKWLTSDFISIIIDICAVDNVTFTVAILVCSTRYTHGLKERLIEPKDDL